MSSQQSHPMTVSATEAALEGFRITRHNPGAVLIWAAVWLVGMIAVMLATLPFVSPFMQEMVAARGNPEALSAGAQAGISQAGFAVLPIVLLLQTLLMPAIYRAVLRPSPKGFGYLRIGRDELRMFIVVLAVGAVSLALNLVSTLLETMAVQALGMVVGALVSMVLFIVSVVISVRLSLITPLTLLREKVAFAEGWRVSRPLFWPLLGMTVLALTMALIVVFLLIMIGWPLWTVTVGAAGAAGPLALAGSLLLLVLMPLGAALVSTILWAPVGAICKNLPQA
jgi:hypothetical protein